MIRKAPASPFPSFAPPLVGAGESWKDRLEAFGVALFAAAFSLLPIECASALGGRIGRAIGPRLGVSRVARDNLRRAFPERDEAAIAHILAGMWDNLGRVAAEYPHLRAIRLFEPGGRVETRGLEHIDRAIAAGRPMILFSGHLANWEIGALAPAQYGIPAVQIYRAAGNPRIDRLLARLRGAHGELIPKGRLAARRAIAALAQGRHLTLLADQKMNDGIAVPFFGRAAMTAPALAHLALRFDCEVLPARVERLAGARFRLTVYPPLPLPRDRDRRAAAATLMAAVNATLESWIRDRPEQWLWVHRRWPEPDAAAAVLSAAAQRRPAGGAAPARRSK